jgi:hypothetical protein
MAYTRFIFVDHAHAFSNYASHISDIVIFARGKETKSTKKLPRLALRNDAQMLVL